MYYIFFAEPLLCTRYSCYQVELLIYFQTVFIMEATSNRIPPVHQMQTGKPVAGHVALEPSPHPLQANTLFISHFQNGTLID